MRGKAETGGAADTSSGITPAYAGKSWLSAYRNIPEQDHPRLCGEKSEKELIAKTAEGSPPPMRGKVKSDNMNMRWFRITPAYAGKRIKILCHAKTS